MNKDKLAMMEKSGLFQLEVERIKAGNCPTFGNTFDPTSFRDEISEQEYEISGMCQQCQDDIFSTPFAEDLEDLTDQAIAEAKAEAHWNDQADYLGGDDQ